MHVAASRTKPSRKSSQFEILWRFALLTPATPSLDRTASSAGPRPKLRATRRTAAATPRSLLAVERSVAELEAHAEEAKAKAVAAA